MGQWHVAALSFAKFCIAVSHRETREPDAAERKGRLRQGNHLCGGAFPSAPRMLPTAHSVTGFKTDQTGQTERRFHRHTVSWRSLYPRGADTASSQELNTIDQDRLVEPSIT